MSERFQFLVSKYLDGALSKEETAELAEFVKENEVLQHELAEALVQASAIRSVMAAEKGVDDEINDGAEIKPFSSTKKHNSKRFQPVQKRSLLPVLIIAALVFIALAMPAIVFRKVYLEEKTKQQSLVAKAENNTSALVVTNIIGQVNLIKANVTKPISVNQPLEFGDTIQTKSGSFVTLKTVKNSEINLNENTSLTIQKSGMELSKGDIYAEIVKQDTLELYKYSTVNSDSISIVGTAFEWSFITEEKASVIKVKEGLVKYQVGNNSLEVPSLKMIKSTEFSKGLQVVAIESIAAWLQFRQYYKGENFVFEDTFKGDSFKSFWTLKSNKENVAKSTPKEGLICEGKDTLVELISPNIPMGVHDREVFLEFEAKNIGGLNNFEYGYEIRSNQATMIRQGFEITQVDIKNYKIRELRNAGEAEDQWVVKSGEKDKLPSIHFKLKLFPSHNGTKEVTNFTENEKLADVEAVKTLNMGNNTNYTFQILFFLKTKSDTAKVAWQFKKFKVRTEAQKEKPLKK